MEVKRMIQNTIILPTEHTSHVQWFATKTPPSPPPLKVQASYCYCMFQKHCITLDKKKWMILVEKKVHMGIMG